MDNEQDFTYSTNSVIQLFYSNRRTTVSYEEKAFSKNIHTWGTISCHVRNIHKFRSTYFDIRDFIDITHCFKFMLTKIFSLQSGTRCIDNISTLIFSCLHTIDNNRIEPICNNIEFTYETKTWYTPFDWNPCFSHIKSLI